MMSPILVFFLMEISSPLIVSITLLADPDKFFMDSAKLFIELAIFFFVMIFPITAPKRVIVIIKGTSDETIPLRALKSIRERPIKDTDRIAKAFPSFIAASPIAFAFATKVSPVSFFEKDVNKSPAPLRISPKPFNGEVILFITVTTVPIAVANVPPIAIPIPAIPILIVLHSLSKAEVVFSTDPLTVSPALLTSDTTELKIFVFIQL